MRLVLRRAAYSYHQSLLSSSLSIAYPFAATTTTIVASTRHMSSTNCAQVGEKDGSKDIGDAAWRTKLPASAFQVLRLKATDARGGLYDNFYGEGQYVCAACETPLYTSAMKFKCGCGWPGFWDCLPKTVREELDADGHRVEILCNACNGHLGHVFRGEGFSNPPPNERHCVNSSSIRFIPSGN